MPLSKRAKEIYLRYEKKIDELGETDGFTALCFGPAHIVWEDFNVEDHHIKYCIINAFGRHRGEFKDATIQLVVDSLNELLKIPEEERFKE